MKRKLAAGLILICALSMTGCNSSDYKEAGSLYDQGKYDEAITIYTELGDYKDSSDKITECNFAKANAYLEAEDYDNALTVYQDLYADSQSEEALDGICACAYHALESDDSDKATEIIKDVADTEKGTEVTNAILLTVCDSALTDGALQTALKGLETLPEDYTYNDLSVKTDLEFLDKFDKFVEINGTWASDSGAPLSARWDKDGLWEEYTCDVDDSLELSIITKRVNDKKVEMVGEVQIPVYNMKSVDAVTAKLEYSGKSFPKSFKVITKSDDFDGTLKYKNGKLILDYVYKASNNGYKYTYKGTVTYSTLSDPK